MVADILKNVMASTAEAELGGLSIYAKEGEVIRNTLEETRQPQHPTPMHKDNSTSSCIINETVKQCISKAIDMRLYWVRDRRKKNNFLFYWAPGKYRMGD